MSQPLKKEQVIGIFGKKAAARLLTMLDDCCRSKDPCCPTEKYTISRVDFISCSIGNPRYNVYVTSNSALEGPVQFTLFRTVNSITGSTGTSEVHFGVDVDTEYRVSEFSTAENTVISLTVIDSRGNWSNTVSITTENCP